MKGVEASPKALPTRFRTCNRWQALGVLSLLTVTTGWLLGDAVTQQTMPTPPLPAGQGEVRGDADFYRAVVARVQAGEGYYDAVARELQAWGYPPHSVFNWRPPLYAWLFGKLPSPAWGQALLCLGVLITLWLAYRAVRRTGGEIRAAVSTVLLIGPFAWCGFPGICLFTELWAGMLIALSIAAYALDRWRLGVAAGLLALFFRELALPYCLIALGLACWQRRRTETAWWLAGLALYSVFLTFHSMAAGRYVSNSDVVHASAWIQFGGAGFVLLTTQINFFLLILTPAWVTALYLPLALLGLAGWRGPIGVRTALTAGVFVAAFTVIGIKPHNAYWGLLYAPLLPLGIIWAPAALRDLWTALLRSSQRIQSSNPSSSWRSRRSTRLLAR